MKTREEIVKFVARVRTVTAASQSILTVQGELARAVEIIEHLVSGPLQAVTALVADSLEYNPDATESAREGVRGVFVIAQQLSRCVTAIEAAAGSGKVAPQGPEPMIRHRVAQALGIGDPEGSGEVPLPFILGAISGLQKQLEDAKAIKPAPVQAATGKRARQGLERALDALAKMCAQDPVQDTMLDTVLQALLGKGKKYDEFKAEHWQQEAPAPSVEEK